MSLAEQPHEENWVPKSTFASRLKELRDALDLTQDEIAVHCGIKPSTWATWELGRSPRNMADVVDKIHNGTKISRQWLIGWGDAIIRWSSDPLAVTCDNTPELPFPARLSLVPP